MTAHEPSHQSPQEGTIGLIAGSGSVPKEIADAATRSGHSVHVIKLRGIADADFGRLPQTVVGLGQVGRMLRVLRNRHCDRIILSGAIQRPNLFNLAPDLGFFLNLGTIYGLMRGGDDTTLRKVLRFFESKGFVPVGIPDIAPALLAKAGHIAGPELKTELEQDIRLAARVIGRLAPFDIGQAVVVRANQVIGIEAAEGTDGLLQRLTSEMAQGGVLVKTAKPSQDLRVDLPTIGPRTIAAAAELGLSAVAVEAGRSVIAQRAESIALAETHQLTIVGIHRGDDDTQDSKAPMAPEPLSRRRTPAPSDEKAITDELRLAARVLVAVAEFHSTAAVSVSRQRVLSIALGPETDAIVRNTEQIGQWGDRAGRHRGAALAFTNTRLLSDSLIAAAAQMGANQIGVLKYEAQANVIEQRQRARELGVDIVELS